MTDSTNPTGTTPYTAPASAAPVGSDPSALENAKAAVTDSVEATRFKLEQTLDAIEDKFDVKKRTDEQASTDAGGLELAGDLGLERRDLRAHEVADQARHVRDEGEQSAALGGG